MKNYIIRSEYECLIKHKNGESIIDSNTFMEFSEPERLTVFPVNTNKTPIFTIDIASKNKSPFFVNFFYEESEIFFIKDQKIIKNTYVEKIETDGKVVKINLNPESITFCLDNIKKEVFLEDKFQKYFIYNEKDVVLVHLVGKVEQIISFSLKDFEINQIQGDKVQKIDDQIVLTKKENDFASSEFLKTYTVSSGKLKEDRSKIKNNSNNFKNINPSLVPIAFLESVKLKNIEMCENLLCEELSKTSPEHFEKFFGRILSIVPLENFDVGVIGVNSVKIYRFKVESGKICEIDVVN